MRYNGTSISRHSITQEEKATMPLDPQVRVLLDMVTAMGIPPMHTLSVEEARQNMVGEAALAGPEEVVAYVEDREIAGPGGNIPIRIYTPEGQGPFPVLVYFHGGGWVIGNISSHDGVCRSLTN